MQDTDNKLCGASFTKLKWCCEFLQRTQSMSKLVLRGRVFSIDCLFSQSFFQILHYEPLTGSHCLEVSLHMICPQHCCSYQVEGIQPKATETFSFRTWWEDIMCNENDMFLLEWLRDIRYTWPLETLLLSKTSGKEEFSPH